MIIAATAILRTLGQVGLTLLMALLSGKTVKRLLLKPMEALAKRTRTREDDQVVESIAEDWGVPEAIQPNIEEKAPNDAPTT